MIQLISFLFFLLPVSNTEVKLHHSNSASIDTVKIVNSLKTQFTEIDSKRKLYSQYLGSRKENGSNKSIAIGFFEGSVLKKIDQNNYQDLGKSESNLYLNENGVFLIYNKVYEYLQPLSIDPKGSTKSITENWYYFDHENLIKWVSAGKVKPSGSVEFKKLSKTFKEEFKTTKAYFTDTTKLQKLK